MSLIKFAKESGKPSLETSFNKLWDKSPETNLPSYKEKEVDMFTLKIQLYNCARLNNDINLLALLRLNV